MREAAVEREAIEQEESEGDPWAFDGEIRPPALPPGLEDRLSAITKAVDVPPGVLDAPTPATEGWETRLLYKRVGDGQVLDNVPANAITILRNDVNWRGVLAWDEFTQTIVFRREPAWYEDDAPAEPSAVLDDAGVTRIAAWLRRHQTYQLRLDDVSVYKAARSVALSNPMHSLRDKLEALTWDGKPRLDTWLTMYLGAQAKRFSWFAGRKFLISAVARVYRPGCQADFILILEGEQNKGKSSALRVLFGEQYSETPLDLGSKDRFLALRGVWCQCFDELASLAKSEHSAAKTFITSPVDNYRPPYGQTTVRVKRQCVFAGTVNPVDGIGYLKDPTGNRRYWPVKCADIAPIDRAALERDREQIWAEAVAAFKAGERWWPETDEENALCRAEQEKREEQSPWEERVERWLEGLPQTCKACGGTGGRDGCYPCKGTGQVAGRAPAEFVTLTDVLEYPLGIPVKEQPLHFPKVAAILAKLGWTSGPRVRRNGARVTPYYPPGKEPDNDIDIERDAIQHPPLVT